MGDANILSLPPLPPQRTSNSMSLAEATVREGLVKLTLHSTPASSKSMRILEATVMAPCGSLRRCTSSAW